MTSRLFSYLARPQRLRLLPIAAMFSLLALSLNTQAATVCEDQGKDLLPDSIVNLRLDNDMFGASGQDQGYTNGFRLTMVSPNLVDYLDDPCLPAIGQAFNSYLQWIQPKGFQQQNMVFSLGQAIFTPSDRYRTDLITNDRPYAGLLFVSFGYNARSNANLRTTQLRLGMVGPAALGRQAQNGWHNMIGIDRFQGWQNQLRNEPVAQLIHERMHRIDGTLSNSGWGWDAITHWGGSVGNLATYANVGAEWRFGWRLPDDFGSAPIRPAGENTAPTQHGGTYAGWSGHGFVTTDVRAVAYDITLDGNMFSSSHSVKKRHFVGDIGYGLALTNGLWKVAFARYHRSREFEGQQQLPVFGSVTVSRRF